MRGLTQNLEQDFAKVFRADDTTAYRGIVVSLRKARIISVS